MRPPRVVGPFHAETKRAALIGQLHGGSERGQVLAEVLADVETDDLMRLSLTAALQKDV